MCDEAMGTIASRDISCRSQPDVRKDELLGASPLAQPGLWAAAVQYIFFPDSRRWRMSKFVGVYSSISPSQPL